MESRHEPDILQSLELTFEDFTDKVVIGKGKDCKIFSCVCDPLLKGERVAIKAYERGKLSSVKLRSVRREARMMRCLTVKQIPNTTRFYGAFQDALYLYIVMEYCPKGDLLELLIREGRAMTEKRICNMVVVPLLTTLQNLHSLGMIHRDIKLENIFVDEDMRVKMGDFGLTMSSHEERAISPVGTVEYMAPELVKLPSVDRVVSGQINIEDIVPVSEKVDIWALGVTCFELVSGRSPFEGPTKDEVRNTIRENRPKKLPSFVTTECMDFISLMMTYDAGKRPSASRMLAHPFVQRYHKSGRMGTVARFAKDHMELLQIAQLGDSIGTGSPKIKASRPDSSTPKKTTSQSRFVPEEEQVAPRCKSEKLPRRKKNAAQTKGKENPVVSTTRHVSEASPAGPLLQESRISSRKKTKLWSRFTRFWSGSSDTSKGSASIGHASTFGSKVTDFLSKRVFRTKLTSWDGKNSEKGRFG